MWCCMSCSQTCKTLILAVPNLDKTKFFFKCHITVLVHGVLLITNTCEELLFQSLSLPKQRKNELQNAALYQQISIS